MARVLRKAVVFTSLLVVGLSIGVVGAVFLMVDGRALVNGTVEFTPDDVARGKALLERHDPRHATEEGRLRTADITGDDVSLMVSYAASRLGGSGELSLVDREAHLRVSVPLPPNPLGVYVNVSGTLRETAGLPRLESVAIGRLPVPAWLANAVATYAVGRLSGSSGQGDATDVLRAVTIGEDVLRLEYEWSEDLLGQVATLAVPVEDAERLRVYHERIVQVVEGLPSRRSSLTDIVQPVMDLARERSGAADPTIENRAGIIALAFYVTGKGPAAVVPGAGTWPQAQPRTILLRGRDDLPKHFTVSAALAVTVGTPLSDAVGLFKEVDDSHGGSGFSFSDIAADRAGTVFGEMAFHSEDTARRLQARIGEGLTEADLLPDIGDLADSMPHAEFERRFGGVGAPAYTRVVEDIERRVAGTRLFR